MKSRMEFKIDFLGGSGQTKMMSLNWGVAVLEVRIAMLGMVLLGYPVTSFFEDFLVLKYPLHFQKMKILGSLEVSFQHVPRELLHPRELLRHSTGNDFQMTLFSQRWRSMHVNRGMFHFKL